MAKSTTDNDFKKDVLESDVPVLVDFWAPWCGPCRALTPVIDELSQELEGKAKIFKLNVDENQNTAAEYSVTGIPTVIIFKNGEIAQQFVGVKPKATYLEALK